MAARSSLLAPRRRRLRPRSLVFDIGVVLFLLCRESVAYGRALLRDLGIGLAALGMDHVSLSDALETSDRHIDVAGLDLDEPCSASGALGREEGGAAAAKKIKH